MRIVSSSEIAIPIERLHEIVVLPSLGIVEETRIVLVSFDGSENLMLVLRNWKNSDSKEDGLFQSIIGTPSILITFLDSLGIAASGEILR